MSDRKLKRITKLDEIPPWFDLENYKECSSLDDIQWHSILGLRKWSFTRRGLQYHCAETNQESLNYFIESMKEPLRFKKPSMTIVEAVQAPTFSELDYFMDLQKDIEEDQSFGFPPRRVPIFINLVSSDKMLMREFQKLLSTLRPNYESALKGIYGIDQKEARTRRYNTEVWGDYGLLPYIDLRIWEHITNHHISWEVISEAIVSKDIGSVDQTRQTIHKLAEELVFSGHGLATLERSIAASDS